MSLAENGKVFPSTVLRCRLGSRESIKSAPVIDKDYTLKDTAAVVLMTE